MFVTILKKAPARGYRNQPDTLPSRFIQLRTRIGNPENAPREENADPARLPHAERPKKRTHVKGAVAGFEYCVNKKIVPNSLKNILGFVLA